MAMRRRAFSVALVLAALACTACGGGPRSTTADLLALHQPTPDPTLDAVVRDLPHALAGVAPTATPTAVPTLVVVPKPAVKQQAPAPSPKPAARQPAPSPASVRP